MCILGRCLPEGEDFRDVRHGRGSHGQHPDGLQHADDQGLSGGVDDFLGDARACDTTRDTVYRDLRARGIDPASRYVSAGDRPRYAPLRFEAVDEFASLMATVLLPSMMR
jgi:hypothetical protein